MSDQGWRSKLNDAAQKIGFRVGKSIDQKGPDHKPTWTAKYFVNNVEYGCGEGANKDVAFEKAAEKAVKALQKEYPHHSF
ncbi:hypothetical protein BDQ17DRAFT_1542093 [Cyathus striatus]|nr:hypothetical protein BDQ17DRAFT_1550842 [Cyathus striatus]KAF9003016.1 hypothetical protein BDQ17DRAFT_1542093 [Cyathus striatus]